MDPEKLTEMRIYRARKEADSLSRSFEHWLAEVEDGQHVTTRALDEWRKLLASIGAAVEAVAEGVQR